MRSSFFCRYLRAARLLRCRFRRSSEPRSSLLSLLSASKSSCCCSLLVVVESGAFFPLLEAGVLRIPLPLRVKPATFVLPIASAATAGDAAEDGIDGAIAAAADDDAGVDAREDKSKNERNWRLLPLPPWTVSMPDPPPIAFIAGDTGDVSDEYAGDSERGGVRDCVAVDVAMVAAADEEGE